MKPPCQIAFLLLLAACESATSVIVDIELDDGLASSYSADEPGILVVRPTSYFATAVLNLCGDEPEQPIEFIHANEFSCLSDSMKGTTESVDAWIEPLPDGWDAEAFCALERRNDWSDLSIDDEVTGDPAESGTLGLVDSPESDWPQGIGSGKWKRVAVTPCGGSAKAEVFVE
ncbi:MAG: hypothetical protein HN348_22200 [Proteobacteria bacterium]|nr:hypothetical protein [Pseudomonadota bacterium]